MSGGTIEMTQARLERTTYCLGGSRSIHLSYWAIAKEGEKLRFPLPSRDEGEAFVILLTRFRFQAHDERNGM